MRVSLYSVGIVLISLLIGCSSSPPETQQIVTVAANIPVSPTIDSISTETIPAIIDTPVAGETSPSPLAIEPTLTPASTSISIPTLSPDDWMDLPVVPHVSGRVNEIYQRGIELGNNPQAFSKVGDCGSTPAWFLGDFDRGPKSYNLGEHIYLEPVIDAFNGSYERTSLAAKSGFNASSIFTPLWANREHCQPDETPLACEYRIHRPIMAFIMLGSNDVWHLDTFEPQMRKIIETSIDNGVIPVLSTKADNLEEDHIINQTIAQLAMEYQVPLINYWRAVQELPDHGLQEDGVHITWGPNRFNDPQVMKRGWPVRNLTTLQTLDVVWRAITDDVIAQ